MPSHRCHRQPSLHKSCCTYISYQFRSLTCRHGMFTEYESWELTLVLSLLFVLVDGLTSGSRYDHLKIRFRSRVLFMSIRYAWFGPRKPLFFADATVVCSHRNRMTWIQRYQRNKIPIGYSYSNIGIEQDKIRIVQRTLRSKFIGPLIMIASYALGPSGIIPYLIYVMELQWRYLTKNPEINTKKKKPHTWP